MKIGIITHPVIYNYGGILQNYALQQVLKDMGHEVYTIDRLPKTKLIIKILSVGKRALLKLTGKKVKLRSWQTQKESDIINKNTRGFVKKHIQTTNSIYKDTEINKIHEKYNFDAYIVGSDQVWRRNDAHGNDTEFLHFLANNNKVKKVAYSASFGVSEWEFNEDETKRFQQLAQLFDAISVREDAGVVLCKNHLKVEAEHLVDPTMLLSKNQFISLVKNEEVQKSEGTLFSYVLDRNKNKNQIINEVSKTLELKDFEVLPEQNLKMEYKVDFDINKCVFPKIEQWLKAFIDAEFIITDSFHGTAFSILFNKPFIAIVNKSRGASRFYSLLKTFDLENRAINQEDELSLSLLDEKIDFEKVNKILDDEKKKSFNFLTSVLND